MVGSVKVLSMINGQEGHTIRLFKVSERGVRLIENIEAKHWDTAGHDTAEDVVFDEFGEYGSYNSGFYSSLGNHWYADARGNGAVKLFFHHMWMEWWLVEVIYSDVYSWAKLPVPDSRLSLKKMLCSLHHEQASTKQGSARQAE